MELRHYLYYFCQVLHNKFVLRVEIVVAVELCWAQNSGETEPHLEILPKGDQTIRANKNFVLYCRAQVPNSELVKDLKWIDPEGKEVSQDSR